MLRRSRETPRAKTADELVLMREAGRMVAEVLALMAEMVAPGVTTGDLNEAAGAKIKELGADRPSFLNYVVGGKPYPANICVSIDEEIVHGIPGRCVHRGRTVSDRPLREGQVVSIDCGVVYQGYHGDSAVTLPVGEIDPAISEVLAVCRDALWAGIEQVQPGNRLTDVARAIEAHVRGRERGRRFGIVEEYVGHGIGRNLHEAPQVPNYVSSHLKRNDIVLEPGLVICIEPMVCLGTRRTRTLSDGWTVVTRDGKPAAHFEHTIAVTEDGHEVFTRRADGGATH